VGKLAPKETVLAAAGRARSILELPAVTGPCPVRFWGVVAEWGLVTAVWCGWRAMEDKFAGVGRARLGLFDGPCGNLVFARRL